MDLVRICDDLIACAARCPNPIIKRALLDAALKHLEDVSLSHSYSGQAACILDIQAALAQNGWALSPLHGDVALPPDAHVAIKKRRLMDEIRRCTEPSQDFFALDIEPAIEDMRARHGVESVLPFLQECWETSQIFQLDAFFWIMFERLRCEAFEISREQCREEIVNATIECQREPQGVTILNRARAFARRDATLGRRTQALARVVIRERETVDRRLAESRTRGFNNFLRGLFGVYPTYYTLRDLYFELHFLSTDPDDQTEFEHQETLVDEYQADIGQMLLMPGATLAFHDVTDWTGRTVSYCRRHVSYWRDARAQLNDELADMLLDPANFTDGAFVGSAAELRVKSFIENVLAEGFIEARQILEHAFSYKSQLGGEE
jgi:hypothetical protein